MVTVIMVKNRKDTLPKLLCLEMLLQCSFSFGLKELINVKKVQLRHSFFFFENAKNLARSDDAKRQKKGNALTVTTETFTFFL